MDVTWRAEWRGEGRPRSELKGDDGVDFVHVVRAVPEHPGEVVCVGRVVHLQLVAEAAVLGEGVDLSFVMNHLDQTKGDGTLTTILIRNTCITIFVTALNFPESCLP